MTQEMPWLSADDDGKPVRCVLDWLPERGEAVEALHYFADSLVALGVQDRLGVRIEPFSGGFQVILCSREAATGRPPQSLTYSLHFVKPAGGAA